VSDAFRAVALDLARRAGDLLLRELGGPREIAYKGGRTDLVTEMDRRAEALIVSGLVARFPGHAILAEERGAIGAGASHRWIVDPLDGTTNYAHGLPIFAVSLALEVEGRVVLGVVLDPVRDECFAAERGRGATLNGAPLRVSAAQRLDAALVATGLQYGLRGGGDRGLAAHAAVARRCRSVRQLGSAVLSLAGVAAGRLDGFWELELGAWDVAAGALLVEEAGGRVTAPDGGPVDLRAPAVIATNGRVHDALAAAVAGVTLGDGA
jgi:myo-inositol-1(or 4)-monophosphatase